MICKREKIALNIKKLFLIITTTAFYCTLRYKKIKSLNTDLSKT